MQSRCHENMRQEMDNSGSWVGVHPFGAVFRTITDRTHDDDNDKTNGTFSYRFAIPNLPSSPPNDDQPSTSPKRTSGRPQTRSSCKLSARLALIGRPS